MHAEILNECMSSLKPRSSSMHSSSRPVFISKDLHTCSHVFIHRPTKVNLRNIWMGPYKVIKRYTKTFIVNIDGTHKSICIDRLKPAYLENSSPFPPDSFTIHTSSNHSAPTPNVIPSDAPNTSKYGRARKKTLTFNLDPKMKSYFYSHVS